MSRRKKHPGGRPDVLEMTRRLPCPHCGALLMIVGLGDCLENEDLLRCGLGPVFTEMATYADLVWPPIGACIECPCWIAYDPDSGPRHYHLTAHVDA